MGVKKVIDYYDKGRGRCTEPCCRWTYDYCGKCLRVTQYSHTGIPIRLICINCEAKNN